MPAELDDCVDEVMSKGHSEESAYAICNEAVGKVQAKSKSSFIQSERFTDPKSGKFFIRAFLLDPTINLNQWAVTRESIDKNINTFVGKPLVLTEKFDHPIPPGHIDSMDHWLAYQESYRVGTIIDIVKRLNPRTGSYGYHAVIEIANKDLGKAIRDNQVPLYVSPALAEHVSAGVDPEQTAQIMSNWSGVHLAIVDEPAFGIRKAIISDTCAGNAEQCLLVLRKAHIEKHGAGNCGFCIKGAIEKRIARLVSTTTTTTTRKYRPDSNPNANTSQDTKSETKPIEKGKVTEEISKVESVSDSNPVNINRIEEIQERSPVKQQQQSQQQVYKSDSELLAENQRLKNEIELARMKIQELQTAKTSDSERIAALELLQRRKDIEHIITAEIIKDDKERLENIEFYTASAIPIDQIARHFNQMKMVIRKASVNKGSPRVPYLSASSMGTGSGIIASGGPSLGSNNPDDEDTGLTPTQKQFAILRGGL